MKVTEVFVIDESPQALWEFFEQIERVARCVPGVESVTVVDADNSQLRVTQALGPMNATFDVKMRITERDPGRSMQFTAVGRSVRGAAGNVRATHTVRLEENGQGSTRIVLEGDLALGGMLGSVGQKVVAKQAEVVTQDFAEALRREFAGGAGQTAPPAQARDPVQAEPAPHVAAVPPAAAPAVTREPTVKRAVAAGMLLVMLLAVLRRRRARY